MYNLWYFVAFYAVLLQKVLFFAIYAVFRKIGLLQFTRYCVEKILAKNSDRGEKMTNIRYAQSWGKHVKKWVELRSQIQNRKDENANPREKSVHGSLCPVPACPRIFPTHRGSSVAAAACWSTCCISRLSRWPAVVGATSPLLDGGPRAGRGRACYRCPVALPRTPASGRATGGWEPLPPRG